MKASPKRDTLPFAMTDPLPATPAPPAQDVPPSVPPNTLTPQQDRERKITMAVSQGASFLRIIATGLGKIYREIMMMILKR